MEIIKKNNYDELSEFLGEIIWEEMKKEGKSLISLPSGDTPLGAYKYLVGKLKDKDLSKYDFTFIGLDEWVGMDKDDQGSCQNYMHKFLFDKLNLNMNQVVEFDAKSDDLNKECEKMDRFIIDNGGLDLVVLGIGMNGHLGLNEPNMGFDKYSFIVKLSDSTKQVAQKYFDSDKKLEQGITLGIKHFLDAKKVVLVASGDKKSEIIKKIIDEDITENIPATSIKQHKNAYLLLDNESAKLV